MPWALLMCATLLMPPQSTLTPATKTAVIHQVGEILSRKAFAIGTDFSTWPDVVARHQKDLDDAQTEAALAKGLEVALSDFHLSHLSVLPPGKTIPPTIESFGFIPTVERGQHVVKRVISGTEADRLGFYEGMPFESYEKVLFQDGNRLRVSYRDAGQGLHTATLRATKTAVKFTPSLKWLEEDAWVLRVGDFGSGYDAKEVNECVKAAAKVPNLVIDFRGNRGGRPENVAHFLGCFLKAGVRVGAIFSQGDLRDFQSRTGLDPAFRSDLVRWSSEANAIVAQPVPEHYKGHFAVVIDDETAGEAEIAAVALRDFADVPIFGARSAGAVFDSGQESLAGGFTLVFPSREFCTAAGVRLEGHRIVPDYESPEGADEMGPNPVPLRLKIHKWFQGKYGAHPSAGN